MGLKLPRSAEKLRDRRLALFDQLEGMASAADLLNLQLALAEEIKLAEAAISGDRDSPEYDHRQLLRMLGDAIAWQCLDPYTIRQLHHRAGAPPNLSNQSSFEQTLEAAQDLTKRGTPTVICDLTHCLGTGDIIGVTSERPLFVEVGNPRFTGTPRKRRQAKRANAAIQQLNTGEADWPDRQLPTRTVELSSPREHVYDALQGVILAALDEEQASEAPNSDQMVFACRAGSVFDTSPLDDLGVDPKQVAFAVTALHERLPNPRIAPPHVWPINAECRRAVIESDVIVGHAIRLDVFDGPADGEARLLGAERRSDGIYIKADNGTIASAILPGPVDELLGNYETVQSSIRAMLETLNTYREWSPDGPVVGDREISGVPPDIVEDTRRRAARRAEGQS
jgi:hypothetical protein